MEKPIVYNPFEAEREIARLKEQVEKNKAHWVIDDDGIYCDNCKAFFYYDENLKKDEELFRYCPECGSYMEE